MLNGGGRNNFSKVNNIGAGVGGTCITSVGKNLVISQQNQKCLPNSTALKDAVSIKSFKENQNFIKDRNKSPNAHLQKNYSVANNMVKHQMENNSSFEKMMLMENFKHYNKLAFKKGDSHLLSKHEIENNAYVGNVIQTKPDGKTQKIETSASGKEVLTPSRMYSENSHEIGTATNFTTLSKNSRCRPPSMRIKRSSSKKNREKKSKFFGSAEVTAEGKNKSLRLAHSNDSRDKSAQGLINVRKSEDFENKKMTQNQSTALNNGGHRTMYQNLSSKMEQNVVEIQEKIQYDKRFVECTTKARAYDLLPRPDTNYLKRILETEKDERYLVKI